MSSYVTFVISINSGKGRVRFKILQRGQLLPLSLYQKFTLSHREK